jgi:hypothetical protein
MTKDSHEVRWCCSSFKSHAQTAGRRGYGVFVDDSSDPIVFILQHRSLEPEDPKASYDQRPLTLVAEIGIQHCPWCGQKLAKWYRKDIHRLARVDLSVLHSATTARKRES